MNPIYGVWQVHCVKLVRGPPAERGCLRLFLARLLDTLLTGVEGALLALGRVHHVLLGLGI